MSAPSTAGIIASFNQVEFIEEAVRSLVEQADEVVLVDDASTDGTAELVQSLRLPSLTVLRNDTQSGVSASFNRAAASATADVLLIQGGDDRSLPTRAEAQSARFTDPAVRLVHSAPLVIDQRGRALPHELAAEFLAKPTGADPLGFLFFEANYICAPGAAVRRVDYLAAGGFPLGLDLVQDYALWLTLAKSGEVVDLGEPHVEYRKHGANLSREYVGLDSARRRRLAAEMESVRNRFLDAAPSDVLLHLAAQCGLEVAWASGLEAADLRLLIRLSHQDKLVSRRGLSTLFEIAAADNGDDRLAALRLERGDLSRFSTQADHGNLEDVGRALAAVRALREITTD